MSTLDDEIARHLQAAEASGELRSAASYGKPMPDIEGWHQTPPALRMPFKILKDAGVAPYEVLLFRRRATLLAALKQAPEGAERRRLQQQLSDLQQLIALRLEALRRSASRR